MMKVVVLSPAACFAFAAFSPSKISFAFAEGGREAGEEKNFSFCCLRFIWIININGKGAEQAFDS
jgi:hypothetical protein